jgi:hypothetical protein
MQAALQEQIGRTVLLDKFVVELRIAATLDHEVQRGILMRLDDSRFWRRVLPVIVRELHDSKMNEIQAVIVR